MRLSQNQVLRIAHFVFKQATESPAIDVKGDKEVIKKAVVEIIKKNMAEEAKLDQEVEAMMDNLEKQHSGSFERYKMFPMLKKKIAQQKGFVL